MNHNENNPNTPPGKGRLHFNDRDKKLLLILFAAIAFYFVIAKFSALRSFFNTVFLVLRPLLVGFAMAFLMNPMMRFMERHIGSFLEKKRGKRIGEKGQKFIRVLTVILSAAILIGLIAAFLSFVVPQFYDAVQNLAEHLEEKIVGVIDWADDLTGHQFAQAMEDAKNSDRIKEFIANAKSWITAYLKVDLNDSQSIAAIATTLGTDAIMVLVNVLVGLFLAIYMLLCKERYTGHIKRFLYAALKTEHANIALEIGRKAKEIFYGFIIGKMIDSAIIGVICFFSMLIMRMPYPILCSFVVGVTNIIPVFGPYIGATPTVILLFVTDPPKGIIFLIYILILQQIDGNLIGPKILGDSTGISSFWVIIAVVVGGSLFGFMGMLIGVPTLALLLYIVDKVTELRARKKHLPALPEEYIEIDHIEAQSGQVVYQGEEKGDSCMDPDEKS